MRAANNNPADPLLRAWRIAKAISRLPDLLRARRTDKFLTEERAAVAKKLVTMFPDARNRRAALIVHPVPSGGAMGSYRLNQPVNIDGSDVDTLEDAAYAVRQQIIRCFDLDGPKIVRALRAATTHDEALRAEASLQAWLLRNSSSRAIRNA